ncbi:cytochrome b561 [Kaistia soli DSM 19436]|uniref:Cytochrome b561 n=1 Tax=Kaistia soli DSM 19436 TaxID=1122133 RepID=A0A1M5JCQ7_9HYPH|nr:cytochrome b [Kaistia soli]SHG37803.1 cytochrome b561 [Kaistia soli DSM 19436]
MSSRTIGGYSSVQVLLHWVIAALVFFQLIFGESMSMATRAARRGTELDPTDATLASAHYWVGIAILVLVAFRLAVRLVGGAPDPQSSGAPVLDKLAHAAHWLFYILLVGMPVTGLLAVYVWPELGEIHELGKPVFIVLIALHVLGALYHQFWLKDGTLRRMFVPAR